MIDFSKSKKGNTALQNTNTRVIDTINIFYSENEYGNVINTRKHKTYVIDIIKII